MYEKKKKKIIYIHIVYVAKQQKLYKNNTLLNMKSQQNRNCEMVDLSLKKKNDIFVL